MSLTSVELAGYAAEPTRIVDIADAGPRDKRTLASLMSRAIQRFFFLAPPIYRRTTVSETLVPPETFTFNVWEDNNEVSGTPFLQRHRGCTIFVEGDTRPNEVTSENTLLNNYAGDSGERTAILYSDCIPILDFSVERICTVPERISEIGQSSYLALLDMNGRTVEPDDVAVMPMSGGSHTGLGDAAFQRNARATFPTHCWIEPVGGSQQVELDAVFQMRLWPLPTKTFLLRFDAEIRPFSISISDLTKPSRLPIDGSLAHQTIIPLVQAMAATSLIRSKELEADQIKGLKDAAFEAEDVIKALPPILGPPKGTLSTPVGW